MAQAAVQAKMSPQEYLELERASETKHEYADGEIFAMSGGTFERAQITGNITGELRSALRARPCRICPADMRVKSATTDRYVYPDVALVCGPPRFEDERRDTLLNPTAIFEVLSDSTEAYDRGDKFAHYRTIPSFVDYVLASQKRVQVEHFHRQEDGSWKLVVLGPGDRLVLPSIECELAVDELYLKVFDAPVSA